MGLALIQATMNVEIMISGGFLVLQCRRTIRREPLVRRGAMAKKHVFVSFDFDNDRVLKDFIFGKGSVAKCQVRWLESWGPACW